MQIFSAGMMSVINYRSEVGESADVRDLTGFVNLAAIWLSDSGRRKMSSGARNENSYIELCLASLFFVLLHRAPRRIYLFCGRIQIFTFGGKQSNSILSFLFAI